MVDKATRGRTDCAGLAVIGRHRGDVAHNARAMIERLLQALLGMVIDDRRAQRVQVERDGTVVDLALVTADHVARAFAERRNRHAVRIAQTAVDDNRRGLAVFARAGVSQDFVVERKGLDLAIDHKGQRTAHGRRVLNDGQCVEVVELVLGRQGTAVARIGEALQAVFIAVID